MIYILSLRTLITFEIQDFFFLYISCATFIQYQYNLHIQFQRTISLYSLTHLNLTSKSIFCWANHLSSASKATIQTRVELSLLRSHWLIRPFSLRWKHYHTKSFYLASWHKKGFTKTFNLTSLKRQFHI